MTDRELLELAAKAAGIVLNFPQDYGGADFLSPTNVDGWKIWNPLTDDGDALRLAVVLGLELTMPKYKGFGTSVEHQRGSFVGCTAFDDDAFKQTRRAIVIAAAEVGKAMQ